MEETHRLAQFDFTELTVARQLAELHRAGATPKLLARKLAEIERRSLPNAAATVREFQQDEAEMAARLGVIPGDTNAVPESTASEKKSSRRKKDRQR